LTGEAEGVEENVLFVGEGFNDCVEKFVRHVVLVHLFGPEKVFVVHDQQTCNLLQNFMSQVVPPVLLQVAL
jgi:hypothetical protein